MLEREGRVRFERNRGVRILAPTAHDIAEVFELRAAARGPGRREGVRASTSTRCGRARGDAGAALATRRFMDHDERFHELILLAAGNRRLAAIVGRPARRGARARRLDRRALAQPEEIQAEHRAILDALEAGDADRAAPRCATTCAARASCWRRTGGATPA